MVIISLLFSGSLVAQKFTPCDNPEQAMQAYVDRGSQMETLQTDFTQSKTLPYLVEPLITSGKFYASRSEDFRWEQQSPEEYIMILTAEHAHILEGGKWSTKDLKRNRQFGFVSQLLGALVTGTMPDDGSFSTNCEENESQLRIELFPADKRIASYISRIVCTARKSDYLLEEIVMYDAEENTTTITFANQLANAQVESRLFEPEED